ncbi:MAG: GxxExxY protein [Chloroflexi bacterium]|nr:GxxExxY protein [Chloroflexota bacterium]
MQENVVSQEIVRAAVEVHQTLGGPGLLETIYEESLAWELTSRGLTIARQQQIPLYYKNHQLGTPLRLDLLVENCVIVEVKSLTEYNPIFEAQLLTYLRLTKLKLGLVINFGVRLVSKGGIHRVVNGL